MQDFNFIEVSDQVEPNPPVRTPQDTIPQEQHLSYFDLTALNPTPQAFKKLSKRLITKYKALPLAIQPKHLAFHLPQRFDSVYHLTYGTPSQVLFYMALCDLKNAHALRLLSNAIGHELYIIPMLDAAFERYIAEGSFPA